MCVHRRRSSAAAIFQRRRCNRPLLGRTPAIVASTRINRDCRDTTARVLGTEVESSDRGLPRHHHRAFDPGSPCPCVHPSSRAARAACRGSPAQPRIITDTPPRRARRGCRAGYDTRRFELPRRPRDSRACSPRPPSPPGRGTRMQTRGAEPDNATALYVYPKPRSRPVTISDQPAPKPTTQADSTRRRSAQVHGIRRGRVARQRRRRYPPDRAKRPDAHAPQHHETQKRTIRPSRRRTKQGEHVRVRRDRLRLLAHRPRESLRRLRRPLPPAHAHGIRRDVLPQLYRRRRQDHQTSRRKRGRNATPWWTDS